MTFFSDRGDAGAFLDGIVASTEMLHHRGPDDTGVAVVDGDAVFGHKRLSIIDPEGSSEPLFWSPTGESLAWPGGRYVLAFNGEIYNYLELREELVREHGAQFATQGDGEVIAAGYHYWGDAVLDRLRGMFALVIWDRKERRGFAARDPFGIKPMYYLQTADGLYLASEKKALLPFAAGDLGVDTVQLKYLLTYQYVPEPNTLHPDITHIGPGEFLTWSPTGPPHGGQFTRKAYYRPTFRPAPVATPQHLYDEILRVLRESVRLHMRADVPVGAFLSGGIDSTSIVALAREWNPDLLTFTVGFDLPGYSEIEVARESARHLGVVNVPTMVDAQDMMAALPRIVWHLDDPVADPSLVPLYFVAEKAAEQVRVVLSGEGADEFFGGYAIYREPLSLAPLTRLPDSLQHGLRAVAQIMPEGVKGRSFLQRGTTPLTERFNGNARIFTDDREFERLLRLNDPTVRFTDVTGPLYAEAAAHGLDDVTAMQHIDMQTWLRGNILVGADRMSMAHSLELRVPYLDRQVFDVARRIPVDLKLPRHSTITKYALRQALSQVVPPKMVNRPKLGFPTPTRVWLRGPMNQWAREILRSSGAGHLLDLPYADMLLREHSEGHVDHSRKIWTVLCFCIWHAIFVERTLDPGVTRNASTPAAKRCSPRAVQPAANA